MIQPQIHAKVVHLVSISKPFLNHANLAHQTVLLARLILDFVLNVQLGMFRMALMGIAGLSVIQLNLKFMMSHSNSAFLALLVHIMINFKTLVLFAQAVAQIVLVFYQQAMEFKQFHLNAHNATMAMCLMQLSIFADLIAT